MASSKREHSSDLRYAGCLHGLWRAWWYDYFRPGPGQPDRGSEHFVFCGANLWTASL